MRLADIITKKTLTKTCKHHVKDIEDTEKAEMKNVKAKNFIT